MLQRFQTLKHREIVMAENGARTLLITAALYSQAETVSEPLPACGALTVPG